MRLSHVFAWLVGDLSNQRRWGVRRLRKRFGKEIDERLGNVDFELLIAEQLSLVSEIFDEEVSDVVHEMSAIFVLNGYLAGRQKAGGVDYMRSSETPDEDCLAMIAGCMRLAGALPLRPAPAGGIS